MRSSPRTCVREMPLVLQAGRGGRVEETRSKGPGPPLAGRQWGDPGEDRWGSPTLEGAQRARVQERRSSLARHLGRVGRVGSAGLCGSTSAQGAPPRMVGRARGTVGRRSGSGAPGRVSQRPDLTAPGAGALCTRHSSPQPCAPLSNSVILLGARVK